MLREQYTMQRRHLSVNAVSTNSHCAVSAAEAGKDVERPQLKAATQDILHHGERLQSRDTGQRNYRAGRSGNLSAQRPDSGLGEFGADPEPEIRPGLSREAESGWRDGRRGTIATSQVDQSVS